MQDPPSHILIVGSGVFGLSTAWALCNRPIFGSTQITVVDDARGHFPPTDCASFDSSRIVRADYADSDYADLAAAAQTEWRKQGDDDVGGQGRYSESGLMVVAREPSEKTKLGSKSGSKSAWDYSKASYENVARIAESMGAREKLLELKTREEIQEVVGNGIRFGDWGYINGLSGWADASRAMAWLYGRIKQTGRVVFVDAEVEELVTQGDRVVGVKLRGDSVLAADVVLVAAGAWTGSLVDLRGRVEATAQALGYVDITEEEFRETAGLPVVLDFSSGLFVIPPQERVLKVGRHSYGYLNPVTVTTALPPTPLEKKRPVVISRPTTRRDGGRDGLPREADEALRRGLRDLTPLSGLENRAWKDTRLCWYADTRDGDWLVDWHPGWRGLFVATGDSGHAFKFLPVLGERIVDCLMGKRGRLEEKWRWRGKEGGGRGFDGDGDGLVEIVTDDGSRAGRPGLTLEEEWGE